MAGTMQEVIERLEQLATSLDPVREVDLSDVPWALRTAAAEIRLLTKRVTDLRQIIDDVPCLSSWAKERGYESCVAHGPRVLGPYWWCRPCKARWLADGHTVPTEPGDDEEG